ncbi:MAG: DHH family phosphoesterase [Clostridia bacterium]|nr:DHH family phosphoesterase [Clostridia bacterium]
MNIDLGDTSFKTLHDFSIPVTIVRADGCVEWNNKSFADICGREFLYNLPLSDYIAEFDINKFKTDKSSTEKLSYEISHNDHCYRIIADIIYPDANDKDENYYIALYWYDYTKYEILKTKYHDEAFVSCIIVIDNYDDVMQGTPNADKPQLTAFMEESLESVAHEANGILKKYEKDRFFMYIQKSALEQMIADAFSFTEKFKTILAGNKVSPTLSMGVGTDGSSLQQNDAFAYSALDMALGRGGDQVVIKDNEQYHFYGGKTREVEKRTRVKARVVSQAMKEIIQNANQIIIMGHRYADVDVLGSAIGLYSIIRSLGKDAKILLDTYNQTVERFLSKYGSEYSNIIVNKPYANEYITPDTLLFIVDTQKYSMVEEPALIDVTKNIIVIDHHRKSTDFIKDSLITYHEPYASSTSELITEILQYIDDVELNKSEAEALYAGIFMDTKNFTFKTGVRTFEAASYLKRRGVDTIEVKKLFQINLNTFVKKWAIIENASTYKGKVAIATCTKNDEDMQTIVAQAADELLNITDISSSFVICDMGDKIIISARSFGDINVQLITEKLGGGGHMTIAGAQLTDTTVEEVTESLKTAIDEYFE